MIHEFHDPADHSQASYFPEPIQDSLEEVFKEEIEKWNGPIPKSASEAKKIFVSLLGQCLSHAETYEHLRSHEVDAQETLIRVLQLFQKIPSAFIPACCYMRLTNRLSWSLDEIGERAKPPISRQAVDKVFRKIEEEFNMRSRADKSPEAREKYREIAVKRGKKNKQPEQWALKKKWKISLSI